MTDETEIQNVEHEIKPKRTYKKRATKTKAAPKAASQQPTKTKVVAYDKAKANDTSDLFPEKKKVQPIVIPKAIVEVFLASGFTTGDVQSIESLLTGFTNVQITRPHLNQQTMWNIARSKPNRKIQKLLSAYDAGIPDKTTKDIVERAILGYGAAVHLR